ncbi:MAG TPA: LysR substrate-binding domain-containing protein [Steroidobacteraceae bacterium]|nr:LysR substrate-binding domain-containing protein [Steroidobacteraceae bacterium]
MPASAYGRLPLNALRVFEAVATRLSFADAAEALNVTPAAVSQQIKALEEYLQIPVLRRSGRKVELTPEGAKLLPGVQAGLDSLVAVLRETRLMRAGGIVNVSTLSSLMQKWLTPRLHRLHAKFPDLQVDWHTSREAVDFGRSDFHAAVRLGQNVLPGLDYEHLMDEWLVVVASPALYKKHGSIDERDTLKGIPMLQARDEPWSRFEKSAAPTPWPAGPTIIDDSVSVLTAVLEGLGYAPARWSIAAHDLLAGRLVLGSRTIVPSRFRYSFVCPPSYSELPKVCALRSWLKEEAASFPTPDAWLASR